MTGRQPRPGSIGVTTVDGVVGDVIRDLEWVYDGKCAGQHAFLLLADGKTVVGSEIGGPKMKPLASYAGRPVRWIDRDMSDEARALVCRYALPQPGERYNLWTYGYDAALWFHVRSAWLKAKCDDPLAAMCSQRCDRVWQHARAEVTSAADYRALTLFDDGRDPGQVTPGELWDLAVEL